ncbi:MAG: PIN domain-containing protein [Solirubrobacteraceae bacterium]|jgi:predicted nucleic acid-binding protein
MSRQVAKGAVLPAPAEPAALDRPALIDTAVWTWSRDRRFPALAGWFNDAARAGRVLVCDLIVLELVRLAANEQRAYAMAESLASFSAVAMGEGVLRRAREVQLLLASSSGHRRVPPADLLIAASAELASVPVVHYDRDYERIAHVTGQEHLWFVPDGALAA